MFHMMLFEIDNSTMAELLTWKWAEILQWYTNNAYNLFTNILQYSSGLIHWHRDRVWIGGGGGGGMRMGKIASKVILRNRAKIDCGCLNTQKNPQQSVNYVHIFLGKYSKYITVFQVIAGYNW